MFLKEPNVVFVTKRSDNPSNKENRNEKKKIKTNERKRNRESTTALTSESPYRPVYADRTSHCYCNHSNSGGNAAARIEFGKGNRPRHCLPE